MELKRKKLLAREFLILVLSVIISFIAFVATYGYNYKLEKDKEPIIIDRDKLAGEYAEFIRISNQKISNQKWLYDEWDSHPNLHDYSDYKVFFKGLVNIYKADRIEYKWNNVWGDDILSFLKDNGFLTAKKLEEFVKTNMITDEDRLRNRQADKIASKMSVLNTMIRKLEVAHMELYEQVNFALVVLLIIGIIVFPIRFLFYGIRWSYKILKS
jgi:hypothetical protein